MLFWHHFLEPQPYVHATVYVTLTLSSVPWSIFPVEFLGRLPARSEAEWIVPLFNVLAPGPLPKMDVSSHGPAKWGRGCPQRAKRTKWTCTGLLEIVSQNPQCTCMTGAQLFFGSSTRGLAQTDDFLPAEYDEVPVFR